jgi:glutamine---fructose-6-phosphate transaminase (isomerizing)
MCGLFGMVRALDADAGRASKMLLHLGVWAEERGIDGAGLALALPGRARRVPTNVAGCADVRCGRWRVVKRPGTFQRLWRPELFDDLDRASMVLGHTRWATQGPAGRLVNTSPLVVGNLVGTHNGDIDAAELRKLLGLGATVGDTDTAVLLAALEQAGADPDEILEVLSVVVGRAALAWSPLTGPRQLWLARGGLCPLAAARDEQGNLFWASNPVWLRRAAHEVGARLPRPPAMLTSGMLVQVVRSDAGVPDLAGWWQFKPTVRLRDLRIADVAAWRGFARADRDRDRQALRHRVRRETRWPGARAIA